MAAIFGNPTASVFPRWFAGFDLRALIVLLPGTFIPFFQSGPVPVHTAWMCLGSARQPAR